MLGTNRVFNKDGSTVVLESWNGRSMLKRLVQETAGRLDVSSPRSLSEGYSIGRPKVKQPKESVS